MNKVTIVIPFYNSEKFISRCCDSLHQQTLKELEFLFVDDGSQDSSRSIVEKFAQQDSRFRILSQKNQGQGVARNIAIKAADSEYTMFLDADDTLEPNAAEVLYVKAQHENCEVLRFNCYLIKSENSSKEVLNFTQKIKNELKNKDDLVTSYNLQNIKDDSVFGCGQVCWDCFCKTSFLQKNDIHFATTKIAEDNLFAIMVNFLASKISLTEDTLYNHIEEETSVEHTKSEKVFQIFEVFSQVEAFLKQYKFYEQYKSPFKKYIYQVLRNRFALVPQGCKLKFLGLILKNLPLFLAIKIILKIILKQIHLTSFLENIFSIKNVYINNKKHKCMKILGLKILIK